MSRYYSMNLEIKGYDLTRKEAIRDACEGEWNWDGEDWFAHEVDGARVMNVSGEDVLTGGESEAEFARRVRLAVWKANQAFCEVGVSATCLEDLPSDFYGGRGLDEYASAKAEGLLEPDAADDAE